MTHKPISHELTHIKGTDARNHVVRCTCGWAYSSTHLDCKSRALNHVIEYNVRRWDDPRRYDMRPAALIAAQ